MLAPGQRADAKSVHQHRPFVELTWTKWCLAHVQAQGTIAGLILRGQGWGCSSAPRAALLSHIKPEACAPLVIGHTCKCGLVDMWVLSVHPPYNA